MQLGVRIYSVGYGSLAGTRIQLGGFTVHTQLEDAVLRDLATLTGGAYFNGSLQPDLQAVYRNVATQVVTEATHLEVTSWWVASALLVLLAGAGLSLLWFGRLP